MITKSKHHHNYNLLFFNEKIAFFHVDFVVIIYTVSPIPTGQKTRTIRCAKNSESTQIPQKNRETLVSNLYD